MAKTMGIHPQVSALPVFEKGDSIFGNSDVAYTEQLYNMAREVGKANS